MKRLHRSAIVAIALVVSLSACTGVGDDVSASSGSLSIYAFAGEMPQAVVDAFEKETGIKVTLDSADSNETMIAKLASGASGYDVVEPSQYAVQQLIGQKLIEKIDHSKLQGLDNIAPEFLDPSYDPGNTYSIPWVWGTTGLLYNVECTGGPVSGWSALFDPAFAGKIYMLDNMLAAYIVGLQMNGHSAASTSESEIAAATRTLIEQKPLLAGYNSTNYAELVAQGAACVAEAWGGSSTAKIVAENSHVRYIMPEEGGSLWTGNLSVVEGSAQRDLAYKFLNFTLRPDIAALATDKGSLASANAAAQAEVVDKGLLDNPAIYAPAESIARSDFIVDPGAAMSYFQSGWTKVRAS